MNFSCLQENLKQGLFITGHAAGKNINLPILGNVMFETKKGEIKLTSTNLEIGITHTIRGKVEEEGSYTVDAKIINDFVNLLPNKKISIRKKEKEMIIETENYKTKIKGESAKDFPLIPEVDRTSFFEAKIEEFKKAVSQVVFAVSNSESRIELSGVYFEFKEDELILAATDSYRLAEKKIKIKAHTNEKNKKIIIPSKTLQELIRIISGLNVIENETIKFFISDNQILFVINSTEMVSRIIEGQYPDYKQIIPGSYKTTAKINRMDLNRAIKASAIFSKNGIDDVNLDFPQGKNQVVVSSESGQTGESVINIDAEIKGEDNGVIVNYRYLLDGLNNIETPEVKIEIIDNNTPCILRPIKENNTEQNYFYIIMPIKQ